MAAYFTVDGILFDDQDDRRDYQIDNPNHGPVRRFETKAEANASLSGGMLTGTSDRAPERAPPKPLPETKNTPAPAPAPAPAPESDREYRYVKESSDLSGGSSRNVWEATKIGVARGDAGPVSYTHLTLPTKRIV